MHVRKCSTSGSSCVSPELCLFVVQSIHEDGESVPPHLAALVMEVKGIVTAVRKARGMGGGGGGRVKE